ncbi:hypothetical protein GCM10007977_066170 [Dactylosporangium sucinum]|uniref:Uncharacterized protein n=1 Tax=Dactylosporangium sucinum TaxID=1424081 RepID=A0A917U5K3_9ACTN|nr:hypothetical protein [Dactylosporangium sucinum]GGM55238.1 hypothetical protein GCM10007977_066170 [Dactylosporangium sucinum]
MQYAASAADAVATTRAPASAAKATSAAPTCPAAPSTITVSPARSLPCVNSARWAAPAGCTAATSVRGGTPGGTRYSRSIGTTARSAAAPCRPAWPRLLHHTTSPGANPAAPGPAASTVPTRSRPTTNGIGSGVRKSPERTNVSTGFTVVAVTSTSTSVGPGTGSGSGPHRISSGGPSRST